MWNFQCGFLEAEKENNPEMIMSSQSHRFSIYRSSRTKTTKKPQKVALQYSCVCKIFRCYEILRHVPSFKNAQILFP